MSTASINLITDFIKTKTVLKQFVFVDVTYRMLLVDKPAKIDLTGLIEWIVNFYALCDFQI